MIMVMLVLGYGLGSVPFGLVLTRLAGTQDLRAIGSGNIGATNVLRTGRKGLAAATLLLDALKGTLAVIIGWRFGLDAALAAGVGAFLGHLFPLWLRFKGGKGVATYLGLLLGLKPLAALAFALIWLGTGALTRYSSLSALITSLVSPLILWGLGETRMALVMAGLTALLWLMHHANIQRLLRGTEGKIGEKAKGTTT